MYLFSRLFQAARAWRNSGRPKTAKRSAVAVEQLDHRQLLSVNFTGNVATDFPATKSPGRRHLQFLQHAGNHYTRYVVLRKSDSDLGLCHFGDQRFPTIPPTTH